MPVLIDVSKIGSTKDLKKRIITLQSKATGRAIGRIISSIPKTKLASVNTLYSNIKTVIAEEQAMVDDKIVDVAGILVKKHGKQIGTLDGLHKSPKTVLRDFTAGASNYVVMSFPEIHATKSLLIKPVTGDLSAKKDNRTQNTWNISLTNKAVTKYRKQLEQSIHKSTIAVINNTLTGKKAAGIELQIAARIGVAADSITLTSTGGSIVGQDLTMLVQEEVKKRMSKTGTSDTALNYRSGDFVRSINAKVATKGLITYTFNKKRYAVHEKTKGTVTTIKARHGKMLQFIDKKTGDLVYRKSVDIEARPVIRDSIRTVALKLFNKKFRLGLR